MEELITEEFEEQEIPSQLIVNLIEWLRNKGMNDTDIVECLSYICSYEN